MNRPFLWLHAASALVGLAVCAVLLSAHSGHPPGIVFLPLAAIAWLAIHGFLGFSQALASQGRKRALEQGRQPSSWPLELIVVVAGCSGFFLYSLGGLGEWWLSNEAWRAHRTLYLVAQLMAFVCLCGILLRRRWGRLTAAAFFLLLSAYIASRLARLVVAEKSLGFGSVLYACSIILGLGFFGYYLLRSARIRSFFVD